MVSFIDEFEKLKCPALHGALTVALGAAQSPAGPLVFLPLDWNAALHDASRLPPR
jgi:hypothetical protein